MKKTRLISRVLYTITRGMAWIYLVTSLYGAICLLTDTNIQIVGDNTIIEYPFTSISFLILDNNVPYFIFSFLLPVLSYAVFFWLLSNVFKVFYQEKLFTQSNILQLKQFYLANVIFPVLLVGFSSFFVEINNGMYLIIALHLFLGVFIFIISEIFNQGLTLQNEQDLYI